jgi:hypothetical protein
MLQFCGDMDRQQCRTLSSLRQASPANSGSGIRGGGSGKTTGNHLSPFRTSSNESFSTPPRKSKLRRQQKRFPAFACILREHQLQQMRQ